MFDDHYAYPEMVYVAAAERVHAMQRAEAAERARRARRARRVQRVRAACGPLPGSAVADEVPDLHLRR